MLIFGAVRIFFLKNDQMCSKAVFHSFLKKILVFFKKNCRINNIQHLICDEKDYIHFLCKMTTYRSHNDPEAVSQTK